MIYIGGVYGGPEVKNGPVARAIARLVRGRGSGSEGNFGSLDVVFHVPGSVYKPPFTGVRRARFSRRERMLQVQIAVPEDVTTHEQLVPFLAARLLDAIVMAAPVFAKARIAYPLDEYRELAERLGRLELH